MNNSVPHMKYDASGQGVTLHCPACATALVFEPASGRMYCESCGNYYYTHELGFENRFSVSEEDTMECNVYKCRSCGAEINVSDNTCSTFCAFCGQPAVVFDRVAAMKKPQFIIPFSVTKEQAVGLLRAKVNESRFVPKELKDFSIDRVVGIYVPFWLFDIDYSDKLMFSIRNISKDVTGEKYCYREGSAHFGNMTLDASGQLSDDSSRRLEPYYTEEMRPFKADYLSGFYADRFDVESYELQGAAVRRAREIFNAEAIGNYKTEKNLKIVRSKPKVDVTDAKYAMLPAWFLTFRYKDIPYTMLVNGQTAKIVGGLPFVKTPLIRKFSLIFVIVAPLAILINLLSLKYGFDSFNLAAIMFLGGVTLFCTALKNFRDVKISNRMSSAKGIASYSRNR